MTRVEPVWWSGGLDGRRARPLVVVVAGALGEVRQHVPLLGRLVRRGYAVVAVRAPGELHRAGRSDFLVSRIVDRYAHLALTERTCLIGFDFGGRLALGAAAQDERIRVVQLVGAPVARLFDEPELLLSLPGGNLDALVRITGAARRELLPEALGGLALRPETLYPLSGLVRVAYATDDPLTPPQDLALLRLTLERSEFRAFPGGAGTSPSGRALRRWLVDGVAGRRPSPCRAFLTAP
ncbi:alpha/beta fold hydrolase [Streptomyces sp. NPDC002888]|uniref:alpha/beta fold hydrolase n=1 Tax=Streptomyces sp. NPDC002888 TaxID=3364668 RepID=UPI0036BDF977